MPVLERPQGNRSLEDVVDDAIVEMNRRDEEGLASGDGKLFVGLALTTSNRELEHGLGRDPRWVMAVKKNANATVYVDTPHATPRTHIYVRASATVTVNLLVK